MDFARKTIKNQKTGNWTNVYKTTKCKSCKFRKECIKSKSRKPYREAEINPLMRKIRLRFKTKKGLKKYSKRFHKGEVAQGHIFHNLGYREFKMRSKRSCENEVNLFSIAYNLKKIYNKLKKVGGNFKGVIKKIFFGLDYNFYLLES